ncbi:unnamed protein product [Blepharisma stoltei]|uniref:Glutamine amidotransferase domain-containing protein n=1 Tax=Blepharisma stoltei TaxID=1481888 RepID=A0AAU9KDD4_9CILI|nr:unnamed protein product [Blepharisma stoltei]
MDLNVVPYLCQENRIFLFGPLEYKMNEHELGVHIAAARAITEWYGIKTYTQDEWDTVNGSHHEQTKSVMVHVTYFSHLEDHSRIYVPIREVPQGITIPGENNHFVRHERIMRVNWSRSLEFNYLGKALRNETISYPLPVVMQHPDYATLHFADYSPMAKFVEAWSSSMFARPFEKWQHYCASLNQLPSEQALQSLKGIIISGGRFSAYDTHDWMDNLKAFLRKVDREYPHIKLIGICLGSQVIAETFGGKVEKIPNKNIFKCETVRTTPEFRSKFFDTREQYRLIEIHGDNIVKIPERCERWGFSESSPNEIYGIQNKWLGIQGHPNFIGRMYEVVYIGQQVRQGMITKETADAMIADYNAHRSHTYELLEFINQFLRVQLI